MSPGFDLARTTRFVLQSARVLAAHLPPGFGSADRDGFVDIDMLIDAGRIAVLAPTGAADLGAAPRLPMAGRIALPLFVDSHTHLDKGHIWRRAPNPTGDFGGALATVMADREANWSAEDVARRMEFGLQSAYAHGTRAIRTHIDSVGPQIRISWPVVASARERWRGTVELQATPLFGVDFALDEGHMADIDAMVSAHGSNILGAVTYMIPALREALDRLFALAERRGWDLDFPVDESADPAARSLGIIADTAIARRFAGKILVGHCCSLARQEEAERQAVIDKVAKAGLSVVSLPMCNMFLQDRHSGRTPRWRGVTALHELRAAGVNVMIASDNTRDPFYAYGDLDMLEVWREGVRILHLDYPFASSAELVRSAPAKAMGIAGEGFGVGAPADLILTQARDFTELLSRPQSDRTLIRAGAPVSATPPAYAMLDRGKGLAP